ncbi:MAG: zonular occludens toxin domain-containing protein [Candidatus Aenigmatarchaeota archaeon]
MELRELAEELVQRVKNEFDSILVVESASKKGTGKSTFSILLAQEICKIIGLNFDLREIAVFDPTSSRIIDLVKEKPEGFPIIIDEAGRIAYKRNWYKEYQKQLVLFLNLCRKHKKIIILNHPNFWQLDNHVLQVADYRVTILKRGIALVRGKINNPETTDPWMRVESEKLFKKYCKNPLNVNESIAAIKKMPNFLYEIYYGTVDEKLYKEYFKMSKEEEIKGFYEGTIQNKWYYGFEGLLFLLKFYEAIFNLPKISQHDILFFMNLATELRLGKKIFTISDVLERFEDTRKITEWDLKNQILIFFVEKMIKKYEKMINSGSKPQPCSDYKKIITNLPLIMLPFGKKEAALRMLESYQLNRLELAEVIKSGEAGEGAAEGTEESV